MFTRALLILCLVLLAPSSLLLAACKKNPASFSERLVEGKQYDHQDRAIDRPADAREILSILQSVFGCIEHRDLAGLSQWIQPERGVYTDLKALHTSKEFAADLANPEGYLNTYYLSGDALRKHTGDPGQKSLYEVIATSEGVKADYYFQGDECEVRLTILGDMAGESYRFNNPYFIKKDGRWYLFRLP